MNTPVLAALRLRSDHSDWHATVRGRAKHLGYRAIKRGDAVEVWGSHRESPLPEGGRYVDGYALRRVWIGPRRAAVGILPKRFYLDRAGERDRRPEHNIVPNPPPLMPDTRQALARFLPQLQDAARDVLGPPVSVQIEENLLEGATLHGRNGSFPWHTSLRAVHERAGFFEAPSCLEVRLCTDEGVGGEVLRDYGLRFQEAVRKRRASSKKKCVTLGRLLERLEELGSGGLAKRGDAPILFILADSETPPSARLKKVWTLMDRHRLPWRRAYATDDRTWSVADQIGSLLMAAGGLPHAVRLGSDESLPWTIGVDVSHRDDFSRVAAALIDPDGRRTGTWTLDGPRKENLSQASLRCLLAAAADAVPEQEGKAGILVVRDGRLPETENADDYRRDLGMPVTFVEFRKGNNPPMLMSDTGEQPQRQVVGWVPGVRNSSLGFLTLLPQSDQFAKVAKLWMPREWDGIGLGRGGLARILAAQTLTPGLGLKPRRLPAPIYWADGIAGASDEDQRFRGHQATRLD